MEKGTVGIAQFIFTENSKKSYVPVGSYCQHAWYNQFSVGCMKWQHALILEPIWETDLIIIFLPAELTGILTRLLTCVTLRPFSLLLSWKNLFSVQFLYLLLFGQKYSKSKFPLLFALPGQKKSKSNSNFAKIFQVKLSLRLRKHPCLCLPIPYSCHWSQNSVH